jgi:hypothetical protein
MRRLLLAAVLALPAAIARAEDDPLPLTEGPGVELAAAACRACHTTDYIVMNSTFLTPEAWKAEVTKMRVAFGAPIEDDIANSIITYLSENYAVKP